MRTLHDTLTPAEKWERIKNPICANDYALGLNEAEMMKIPELAAIVEVVREAKAQHARNAVLVKSIGARAGRTYAELVMQVIEKSQT